MEIGEIKCDNIGMTKDLAISALSEKGDTQYAFENFNIRILAVNDNTKFTVTNEKSTQYVDKLTGVYLGSCKLNNYLVVFTKSEAASKSDYIYRITYNVSTDTVDIDKLFQGNLNFDFDHPIEALGYYESEEVQKVYWVDGLNQNRFINIVNEDFYPKTLSTLSKLTYVGKVQFEEDEQEVYRFKDENDNKYITLDSTLSNGLSLYYDCTSKCTSLGDFLEESYIIDTVKLIVLDDGSFDFQGTIHSIPNVTITKSYNKAGTFQAGIIQYFITYYNKYGQETCIAWNSDLQYLSKIDRGAKQDEFVQCAFDFDITNIDTKYEYLRSYAVYRSSINSATDGRLVTEIRINSSNVKFTDYGTEFTTIDADNLQYVGGQNIIANTLDQKQDTLFLGDIKLPYADISSIESHVRNLVLANEKTYFTGTDYETTIKESPYITWTSKLVHNYDPAGCTFKYDQQINKSQKDIAGYKYGEFYRFAIQLMSSTGEWTSAIWIGDSGCTIRPSYQQQRIIYHRQDVVLKGKEVSSGNYEYSIYNEEGEHCTVQVSVSQMSPYRYVYSGINCIAWRIYGDNFLRVTGEGKHAQYAYTGYNAVIIQEQQKDAEGNDIPDEVYEAGYYISDVNVDISSLLSKIDNSKFIAYRLLVAETSIATRRIVAQGVLNPTMFNYRDRENNNAFSINSWMFRPRNSHLTHKHYETLPVQKDSYAELQGIMSKKIPGFCQNPVSLGNYDSFALLIAPNYASGCKIAYSLIYYNSNGCNYTATDRNNLYLKTVNKGYTVGNVSGKTHPVEEYWKEVMGTYGTPTTHKWIDESSTAHYVCEWSSDTDYAFNDLNGKYAMTEMSADLAICNSLFDTDGNKVTISGLPSYNISNTIGKEDNYKCVAKGLIKATTWNKAHAKLVADITSQAMYTSGTDEEVQLVISEAMLPTADELKKAWKNADATEVGVWIGLSVAVALSVVATVFTAGGASSLIGVAANVVAGTAAAYALEAASSVAISCAVASTSAACAEAINHSDLKDIDRALAAKGYTCLTPDHTIAERRDCFGRASSAVTKLFNVDYTTMMSMVGQFFCGDPTQLGEDSNLYMIGGVFNTQSPTETDKKNKSEVFCTDESVLTLNSPEFEDENNFEFVDNSEALDLNIVGTIPVSAVEGQYDIQASQGLANTSDVIRDLKISKGVSTTEIEGLLNGFLYQDSKWPSDYKPVVDVYSGEDTIYPLQASAVVERYKTFMWHRNTSLSMYANTLQIKDVFGNDLTEAPAQPQRKIFANFRYSVDTNYQDFYKMEIDTPIIYDSDEPLIKEFTYNGLKKMYYGNVDTAVSFNTNYTIISSDAGEIGTFEVTDKDGNKYTAHLQLKDPIQIRYKSTPHALFTLKWNNGEQATILPRLADEDHEDLYELYSDVDVSNDYKFLGSFMGSFDYALHNLNGLINQDQLTWEESSPYLFMGELVRKEFNYNEWYNGYETYALQQLHWNVASGVTPLEDNIETTWGDTYYQRWDCEKTYPFTEEDKNSVVDVLSFMVESHINIDGRCDTNRGTKNLLTMRPDNSNIINEAYSQPDNFFNYQVMNEKFNKTEFGNEIVWSLTKQRLSDVDSWTNLNALNTLDLDGSYGRIRKILNVNDSLITFQDSAISTIKYNETSALSTETGLPLQMGNTGKVTGYAIITDKSGCHNKWSISNNSAGVFFIDDYNKSFCGLTSKGIQNLGTIANFSQWFRDNCNGIIWTPFRNLSTTKGYKASFDEVTQDLYLINDDTCLVYNALLNKFTSFMSYINTPWIVNAFGTDGLPVSLAFYNSTDTRLAYATNIYKMFAGPTYGYIYGKFQPYSIEYRLNPVFNHDSIFTNYQYVADWVDYNKLSMDSYQFDKDEEPNTQRFTTFDTVEAWNEYQHGIMKIDTSRMGRQPIKSKFRVWRGDIPREGDTITNHIFKSDRMRNPWIHLKFEKNVADNSKMTFHSLMVTYYNQYGRL